MLVLPCYPPSQDKPRWTGSKGERKAMPKYQTLLCYFALNCKLIRVKSATNGNSNIISAEEEYQGLGAWPHLPKVISIY
ncbi:uncharacterized protein VTP21DRAFT_8314 [Calcarisporiella thermophila]|uniref:uncharacterized protein n=1 Tax=Calcarisporiella thermophila TaxID=911321 RepID=UPI0037441F7C